MKGPILLGLFLCSLFTFAQAKDDLYAGVGIGQAGQKPNTNVIPYFNQMTAPTEGKNHKLGAKVYMGYQAHKNMAVEFGYYYLNRTHVRSEVNANNYSQFNVKGHLVNVSLAGTAPLNDRFSLFGKIGAGAYLSRAHTNSAAPNDMYGLKTHETMSRIKLVPVLAVGAEMKLNKKSLALRGEYEHFGAPEMNEKAKVSRLDMLSVGLKYTFE